MKPEDQIKGSWRSAAGDYIYLAAEDFDVGESYTLTIKAVKHDTVRDLKESKKQKREVLLQKVAIVFEETERLLTVNATRARQVSEISGSVKCQNWVGVKVNVFRTEKVYFGKPGSLEIRDISFAGGDK